MTRTAITILVFTAAAGAAACGWFKDDTSGSGAGVTPSVGGAAAGGAGGSGSAVGGAGGSSGSAAGGAGGGQASCAALGGPLMVEVASPMGVKYCIDRTEVTQGQYAAFLKSVTLKPGSEHPDCGGNGTYAPTAVPPDPYEPKHCEAQFWTPETTPNHPVVCVDWCDAQAFCVWAGKRLCGKIGGGSLAITPDNPMTDASQSQWFNACSQGGQTKYPYGDTYDPAACEGADVAKQPDGGWDKKDVGARAGCRGTAEPFDGVRDLSGSAGELVDECKIDTTGPNPVTVCAVRGGTYGATAEQMLCATAVAFSRDRVDNAVGFRCCKDVP